MDWKQNSFVEGLEIIEQGLLKLYPAFFLEGTCLHFESHAFPSIAQWACHLWFTLE